MTDPFAQISEQDLIRELHAAIRLAIEFYGSAQLTAPALGVSNAWLSRNSPAGLAKYASPHRLPRPHAPTLLRLAMSKHNRVQAVALELLHRRGYRQPIAA